MSQLHTSTLRESRGSGSKGCSGRENADPGVWKNLQKELKTGRKPGHEEENITCWNLSKLRTLVRGGLALNTKVRMARSFIKNIAMVMGNIMMEDIMIENMMIKI